MELYRWMERNEKKSSEIFHKLYVFQQKKGISFSKDLYISVATKPSKSQLYNQTIILHLFIFNCEN